MGGKGTYLLLNLKGIFDKKTLWRVSLILSVGFSSLALDLISSVIAILIFPAAFCIPESMH